MAAKYEVRDFHPYSWEIVESTDEHPDVIRVWSFDADSKPNLLIIDSYQPYFYIELYRGMLGAKRNDATIWNNLAEILTVFLKKQVRFAPEKIEKVQMHKLHYYRSKSTFLKVTFRNIDQATKMAAFLKRDQVVNVGTAFNLGKVSFKVHEDNYRDFNLINRLMAERYCKFKYSEWMKACVTPIPEKKRISTIPEWRVKHTERVPHSEIKISPNPRVLSYDIETYTPDHKKYMPKSTLIRCPCYLVTFYCGQLGTPQSEHQREIVVLGTDTINDEFEERGTQVTNLSGEEQLIQAYCNAVKKFDPDIIIGFNINFYDNPYIDDRGRLYGTGWQNCSRLKNYTVGMKDHDFTGERTNKTLVCPGRITVDVFTFVRKNKKLKKYSLSAVSQAFLKEDKRDVPYEEQFVAYKTWLRAVDNLDKSKKNLRRISRELYPLFIERIKNEDIDWILDVDKLNKISAEVINEEYDLTKLQLQISSEYLVAQHLLYRVMDYGDQDAYLPYRLFEKLHIFTNICSMAAVNYINPEEVYIRGESIRCLRMIYQTAKYVPTTAEREEYTKKGWKDDRPYVIDSRIPVQYHLAGGYVREPIRGVHDTVATVDFKSLYPNEMITNNLCYTTLLAEGTPPKGIKYHTIKVPVPEHNIEYTHNWVDPSVRIGIIPLLEINLIAKRTEIRNIQKQFKEGSLEWILKEAQQLAVKIACNAAYGFLGMGCNLDKNKNKNKNVDDYEAKNTYSKLPLPEASMCITYCGRTHIQQVMSTLQEWYPDVEIVYGDTDSAMFHIPSITENYFQSYEDIGKRLSATMPGTLELEMENVSKILLFEKKHYIKLYYSDKEDRLNIDIHGPNYWNNGSERGIPKVRRDRANTVVDVHTQLSQFILDRADPIEIYRWLINYVLTLDQRDPAYFEIIKGYNAQKEGCNKTIVKRMAHLGVVINHMDRFGYIVCDNGATKVGEQAYETLYFLKSQESDEPLKINYRYYVEKLSKLDEMLTNVPPLPDLFQGIEYKRSNQCKKIINFCTNPLSMMASMIQGGYPISELSRVFEELVEASQDLHDFSEESLMNSLSNGMIAVM